VLDGEADGTGVGVEGVSASSVVLGDALPPLLPPDQTAGPGIL